MRSSLAQFVKQYPALSLFLVAVAFGPALVAPVLLPRPAVRFTRSSAWRGRVGLAVGAQYDR